MGKSSLDPGVNGHSTQHRFSDRFLAGLGKTDLVTFVSHVNPDPDGLGSMVGLAYLVETCLGKPCRLTRDGLVNRAENKAMIDLLDLDLVPIDELEWQSGESLVMVDSQPQTGRHSFPSSVPIYAVIDHHQTPGDLHGIPFVDIRRQVGATCSIVTQYLIEQGLDLPPRVATALLYGIETELSGFPREASALDDKAAYHLLPLTDQELLAKIRNAPLPEAYFETVLQALQSSFIYDRLMISWVNDLPQPEMAAQVVDFMIRFEEIDWAVCGGIYGDQLILSMRTGLPRGRAGELLRQVVGRLGKAGGHDRRAGGCIPLPNKSAVDQIQSELRKRLLKALHIEECRGTRLVSRKEMLENIQG